MIRYFQTTRPQNTKGKARGWLYAQANDECDMSDKYWTQLSYDEVTVLLKNDWKFYHNHDKHLYDLDTQAKHNTQQKDGHMKITETKRDELLVSDIWAGTVFKHDGTYYMRTTGNLQGIVLSDGRLWQFVADARAEVVDAELVVRTK